MPRSAAAQERLFYFFMPGCHTCASVKPVMEEFIAAMPHVRVIPADITSIEWKALSWQPKVTPTLIRLTAGPKPQYIVYEGRPAPSGDGILIKPEEVRLWLQQNFSWK